MSQRTRTRDLIYDFVPPMPMPPPCPHSDEGESESKNQGSLYFNTINDFPTKGNYNTLYFNRDENILYCWDNGEYVPVQAKIIPGINEVLDGGGVSG